jgi:LuxR family maltose regulon positive regulatory protein
MKSSRHEHRYYSKRLKRKLDELRFFSVTVIEAPSGYGKTTAIKDYIKTEIPKNIPVYWFAAMDETPAAGFQRLCREIDKIDAHTGRRLLKIGLPNAATIGEACDALKTIQCNYETYLVMDNFHLLQSALMSSFFTALTEHGGKELHIIIITQMLGRNMHAAIMGRGFLHITSADFRLNAEDIRRYYALADIHITLEEACSLERSTEGWIIAVYLQLRSFRETGTFSDTDILSLIEHLVWDVLTKEQQTFLIILSPFENITLRQACVLMKCEALPKYAHEVLQNPFISYDRAGQRYEFHSILSQLLTQKRREQGTSLEHECLLIAGDLCRDEGRTAEALIFYWRIKDYNRLLSLDFPYLIFEEISNISFSKIAIDIVQNCPADIKKAYPLFMLRTALALLIFGLNEIFNVVMKELEEILNTENKEDVLLLRGEWLLLSSFNSYPKLDEMITTLKKAEILFSGKHSQVILSDSPWWFGICSPLTDFHITPGKADEEGELLEKYIALFSKLTNGYGSGADILYRSVLAYHRGNISEAETQAYKAAYIAESKKQSIIQLGATLQLAQVALHKADTDGWHNAIKSMERAASNPMHNSFAVNSALDIMRGMLFAELQQLDEIADWLKKGEFSEKRILSSMLTLALFVHTLYLLHKGEFARVIGIIEAKLSKESIVTPMNKMLLSLNLAVGYLQMGNHDRCVSLVQRTALMVLPDGLVFTFASFSWLLEGITDDIIKKEYPYLFNRFKETKERFGSGWTKLYKDILPEELPSNLTEREREVALLAADGLRNSEIAEKLFISESTVRTHMRTIFKKLEIDRRIKLAEKLK